MLSWFFLSYFLLKYSFLEPAITFKYHNRSGGKFKNTLHLNELYT